MKPTPEQIETLTKTIAVLQAMLNGAELRYPDGTNADMMASWCTKTLSHLSAAPREDEPVAWMRSPRGLWVGQAFSATPEPNWTPLYTRPQPAPSPRKIKRKGWQNIYADPGFSSVYSTRKEADRYGSNCRIACVPIEYEFDAPEGVSE
jgi:hypothetical protein